MSTFNGEKYLEEQIYSIINQKDVTVQLLVRDDGSTDHTVQILQSFQDQGFLTWYSGQPKGCAMSFMDLIDKAPECEYYAFSDQDDWWEPDKLAVAINKISGFDKAKSALYFSRTELVDSELKTIKQIPRKLFCILKIPAALIINNAGGLTMVFNRYLLERIREYHPGYVSMHDSWVYKVCLVTGGQIYADEGSYVKYRQHGNNVLGGTKNYRRTWKRRIITDTPCYRSRVATELIEGYGRYMNSKDRKMVIELSEYKKILKYRLSLLFNPRVRTPFFFYTLYFKLAVLFGLY